MESEVVFLFVAQSCVPQHGNRCPHPGYPKRERLTRSYWGGNGGGLIPCWRGCYWGILLNWLKDFYFGARGQPATYSKSVRKLLWCYVWQRPKRPPNAVSVRLSQDTWDPKYIEQVAVGTQTPEPMCYTWSSVRMNNSLHCGWFFDLLRLRLEIRSTFSIPAVMPWFWTHGFLGSIYGSRLAVRPVGPDVLHQTWTPPSWCSSGSRKTKVTKVSGETQVIQGHFPWLIHHHEFLENPNHSSQCSGL